MQLNAGSTCAPEPSPATPSLIIPVPADKENALPGKCKLVIVAKKQNDIII